jgi:hypothetical protein
MHIRGSEAEVSTVPGGEGFGMAGLGKLGRGLNIGARTLEGSMQSAPFSEPDFNGQSSVELLVSIFSMDFEIRTRQFRLTLPRLGDTETVESQVRPIREGPCQIEIVISTARELEVLQTLRATVECVTFQRI